MGLEKIIIIVAGLTLLYIVSTHPTLLTTRARQDYERNRGKDQTQLANYLTRHMFQIRVIHFNIFDAGLSHIGPSAHYTINHYNATLRAIYNDLDSRERV